MGDDPVKVEIYLDDHKEAIAVYKPPASFDLDTTKLSDGRHRLHVRATDRNGVVGVRDIPFVVRNGPGIAVVGLSPGDIVEGKISVLVNAYGGASEKDWEPTRAETPAPIPTWAWVLFLGIVCWAMWYGASEWTPTKEFLATPTFSSPAEIEAAAPKPKVEGRSPDMKGLGWQQLGATIYHIRCAVCHQEDGKGLPNFVPPIAGNAAANNEDPTEHVKTVLHGLKGKRIGDQPWAGEMPAFDQLLGDDEIAAVIDHERTNYGNNAPLVSAQDVKALRRVQAPPAFGAQKTARGSR
jgi:mono/diheme cytochrome c family protein